jgi:hypothetical protein
MRTAFGALALVLAAGPAMAQTATQLGTVTLLRTGWNADSFGIVTSAPQVKPRGCGSLPGYISTKPARGYDTLYQAALLAYQQKAVVQVVVSNTDCTSGWPRIIGINLFPPGTRH